MTNGGGTATPAAMSNTTALEAARRALEAGDLPGALGKLSPLPPAARTALAAWEGEAQALLAARAAIITLAGG